MASAVVAKPVQPMQRKRPPQSPSCQTSQNANVRRRESNRPGTGKELRSATIQGGEGLPKTKPKLNDPYVQTDEHILRKFKGKPLL